MYATLAAYFSGGQHPKLHVSTAMLLFADWQGHMALCAQVPVADQHGAAQANDISTVATTLAWHAHHVLALLH